MATICLRIGGLTSVQISMARAVMNAMATEMGTTTCESESDCC